MNEALISVKETANETTLFQEAYKGKVSKSGLATGVHLVGLTSKRTKGKHKTPYTYESTALKEAVSKGLYNNVSVQVAHTVDAGEGADTISNRYNNPTYKIGFVKNAMFKEGVGIVGDVQFNVDHPLAPSAIWWANNAPEHLGFSHEAICRFNESKNCIDAIQQVDFIALVGEGNTTNGLFKEGVIADQMTANEKANKLSSIIDNFRSLINNVLWPLTKSFTQEEMAVQLLPIAKDLVNELKAFNTTKEATKVTKENDMELKDVTIDMLKKDRTDLVSQLMKEALAIEADLSNKVEEAVKDIQADKRSTSFMKTVRESIRAGVDVKDIVADRLELLKATKAEAVIEEVTSAGVSKIKESKTTKVEAKVLTDEEIVAAFSK